MIDPTPTPSASASPAESTAGVERNVVVLGWVAFFGGLAQDMIQPILPLFYTSVLGLNAEFIGLIEGSLTTAVSLMRIAAGYLADALGASKPLVFAGYGLSAAARFCLAFAGSGAAAFGLRLTDGVGKGLKDAPRDALVAGSAGRRSLGFAFGIQRTLDTLGSVAGPLATYALLAAWAAHPNREREVFAVAGIVASVPLLLIGWFVRERSGAAPLRTAPLAVLRGPFVGLLAVTLLFTLGNSSDAFLILRAQNLGVPVALVPVAYAAFNLVSAVAAIPAGRLSDRAGRRRVVALGWLVYALAYLGFALARSAWQAWALFAFYGLYYALAEGAGKALVAELVPAERRGAAYGLYSAATGVAALPASLIAGLLWNRVSPAAPFLFGAALAGLALLALPLVRPRRYA